MGISVKHFNFSTPLHGPKGETLGQGPVNECPIKKCPKINIMYHEENVMCHEDMKDLEIWR